MLQVKFSSHTIIEDELIKDELILPKTGYEI